VFTIWKFREWACERWAGGVNGDDLHSEFLRLHTPHQGKILGYLVSAVRDFHAAEDLYQEVTMASWKNFDRYDPARPYLPWVFGIVRNHLSRYYRKKGKAPACLPLDILEDIAAVIEEDEESFARERTALRACIEELPSRHREAVYKRYEGGLALKDLAAALGKSMGATNTLLCRIRKQLLECARRFLVREATT
jgi:RNA polymerase sigma-70 factor (ECF subfamily)